MLGKTYASDTHANESSQNPLVSASSRTLNLSPIESDPLGSEFSSPSASPSSSTAPSSPDNYSSDHDIRIDPNSLPHNIRSLLQEAGQLYMEEEKKSKAMEERLVLTEEKLTNTEERLIDALKKIATLQAAIKSLETKLSEKEKKEIASHHLLWIANNSSENPESLFQQLIQMPDALAFSFEKRLLEQEKKKLEDRLGKIQEFNKEIDNENKQLREKNKEQNNILRQKEKEIDELKEAFKMQEAVLNTQKKENEKLTKEMEALEKEKKALKESLTNQQQQNESLETSLETLKSQSQSIETRLQRATKTKHSYSDKQKEKEAKDFHEKYNTLQQQHDALADENQELRAQLIASEKEGKELHQIVLGYQKASSPRAPFFDRGNKFAIRAQLKDISESPDSTPQSGNQYPPLITHHSTGNLSSSKGTHKNSASLSSSSNTSQKTTPSSEPEDKEKTAMKQQLADMTEELGQTKATLKTTETELKVTKESLALHQKELEGAKAQLKSQEEHDQKEKNLEQQSKDLQREKETLLRNQQDLAQNKRQMTEDLERERKTLHTVSQHLHHEDQRLRSERLVFEGEKARHTPVAPRAVTEPTPSAQRSYGQPAPSSRVTSQYMGGGSSTGNPSDQKSDPPQKPQRDEKSPRLDHTPHPVIQEKLAGDDFLSKLLQLHKEENERLKQAHDLVKETWTREKKMRQERDGLYLSLTEKYQTQKKALQSAYKERHNLHTNNEMLRGKIELLQPYGGG